MLQWYFIVRCYPFQSRLLFGIALGSVGVDRSEGVRSDSFLHVCLQHDCLRVLVVYRESTIRWRRIECSLRQFLGYGYSLR